MHRPNVFFTASFFAGLTLASPMCGGDGPKAAAISFQKQQLDSRFRSEGVAVADVNRDGKLDVLAGALWYEAPHWTPHEIKTPQDFDPRNGYSDSFANFAHDMDRDGWMDLIVVDFPGTPAKWFRNPGTQSGHWPMYEIFRSACNESPQWADLTGDGQPELVMGYQPEEQMAWFTPGPDPTAPWIVHPISEPGSPGTDRFSHGLGVGNLNGDGRKDVLVVEGWWEAPAERTSAPWEFHPAPFGPRCADMHVYDVDADGDSDVISSAAHEYGLWWYEQVKNADGTTAWKQHTIAELFSQSHALALADINGDGLEDLVTGKRYLAHLKGDPGEHEPAVLYWFQFQRTANGPEWIAHQIDDNSGVGTQFVVRDINADGRADVITSNKKGVFVFLQELEP